MIKVAGARARPVRGETLKENVVERAPLSAWWLCAALAATGAALAAAARLHAALPEPLRRAAGPPDAFSGETAHRHLVNLTAIGPRVAGSYENEVAAVRLLLAALRDIASSASPHNRLEIDLHTASGAFPLAFLDGMNNAYRGVQMVTARLSARGADARPRPALLLNCHYDTVPDSPGASDDAAGCAVLLETLRALAATPRTERADLLVLLNGAEENILQGSHGFVSSHRWASAARAFINVEACGAGGREVLFQAGPHDPWIMEVYASVVPRPFASSLAQELFQSGLIPADTDYRIFRDFGNLSGVDLAWSANGYVYHTRLDAAEAVPPAALQRTGDNVLALARGLLASERLQGAPERTERQPVFFDVVGLAAVSARGPVALLAAAGVVALVLADVQLTAREVAADLYVRRSWWWRAVAAALGGWARAQAAGVLSAAAVALTLHAAGARLTWYARSWLLGPLYGAPALAATWWCASRGARPVGAGWALRGWRASRAWQQAGAAAAAAALAACSLCGLRSGFLPALWALGAALGDVGGGRGGWLASRWALGAALPVLQTCYLAVGSLEMFVPVMGRAGAGPVPADVLMAAAVAALTLGACSWALPLVAAAHRPGRVALALAGTCVAACALVLLAPPESAYSPHRPQRLMLFHVRREVAPAAGEAPAPADHFYWLPELDVNTARTARALLGPQVRRAECLPWAYCGLPYYLPVLSLIPSSLWAPGPAAAPAPATLQVLAQSEPLDATVRLVRLEVTGPSHVVVAVAPGAGGSVPWSSVVERPLRSRHAPEYFFALHSARAPAAWTLLLHVTGPEARVSVAGHSLTERHEAHERLLAGLPAWVAATGWPVHLRLLTV